MENNLKPIYCIGETLEEREAGQTLDVVRSQVREGLENFPANAIDSLVLAYEPVWAIGTGKTATDEMAQEVHADIRKVLVEMFGDSAAASVRFFTGFDEARECAGLWLNLTSTVVDRWGVAYLQSFSGSSSRRSLSPVFVQRSSPRT